MSYKVVVGQKALHPGCVPFNTIGVRLFSSSSLDLMPSYLWCEFLHNCEQIWIGSLLDLTTYTNGANLFTTMICIFVNRSWV